MTHSRTNVLFIGQLPPPVHGVTVVNQRVFELLRATPGVVVERLSMGSATGLDDIGRRLVRKALRMAGTAVDLLRRGVRGRQADVVYIAFTPAGLAPLRDSVFAALGRIAARRCILHVHAEGLERIIEGRTLAARVARFLLRGCEIIVITGHTAAVARRSGLFSRTWHVPNAAEDPGQVAERARVPLRITYVSNFIPGKGVLDLLSALEELRRRGVEFSADIIGSGTAQLPLDAVRAHVVERGLGSQVAVHGALYGAEKTRIVAGADIFAYPSRHDHAPLVLIEAMACGLVPIVCDVGGVAEIVGPDLAGNVIPAAQERQQLATRLADLLAGYAAAPERLERDCALARQRFLAVYTLGCFAETMRKIVTGEAEPAPVADT